MLRWGNHQIGYVLGIALVLSAGMVLGHEPPTPKSTAQESPIAQDAKAQIEGIVAFTEGPAWHPTGNVYFTDIVNNRIMRRDPDGETRVFRHPSGMANGLTFDYEGRLLACEGGALGGNRRITRTEKTGVITVLADRFEGKRFNSPNDLALDSSGRIYFTDPRYGDRSDIEQRDRAGKPIEGVYRIDTDGTLSRVITHEVDRPNGIAVSPDNRFLYVADNVNSGQGYYEVDHRRLWRFNLDHRGNVVANTRKLLFDWGTDRGPDGLCLDTQGRIYVTAGFNVPALPRETSKIYKAGVYVISHEGKLIDFIPVLEDMATNCTFGGPDLKTLYITSGHKLWSIPTEATGYVPWLSNKRKGK